MTASTSTAAPSITPFLDVATHRVASVDDLLARCAPAIRSLVQAARRRVLTVVPHATERLRAGWGLLGFDAPRYFAYVAPLKDHVRIGFERGALLDDPAGLLEGNGSQGRHVVIRSSRDLRRAALAALLRQAVGAALPLRAGLLQRLDVELLHRYRLSRHVILHGSGR